MAGEPTLYADLAKYYDRIYHWKDYRREARRIKDLVRRYKRSSGNSLLDVACGTGKHIQFLLDEFECVGVDSSEDMLAVARRNAPQAEFLAGNMTDFRLGRRFDVVLCLFSSVGHLGTRAEVRQASENIARHMKKGGVLVVEPWVSASDWKSGLVDLQRYESPSLKIARMNYGRREGAFSVIDEVYLIGERGKGVTSVKDSLRLRLFELDETLRALKKAGLNPEFLKEGLTSARGLLVATK